MSARHFERRLHDALRIPLRVRGFEETGEGQFVRERTDVRHYLAFPCRFEHRTREHRFSYGAGIRFLGLERSLAASEEEELVPTVGGPIDPFGESRPFHEWYLDGSKGVWEVINEIDEYALPWFETYSDLAQVKRALQDESAPDPFVIWEEAAVRLLAVIVFAEGRRSEAIRLVDEALERWQDRPPKYWWDLKRLRKRFLERGGDRASTS